MNSTILETIGFISAFLLGVICFRASRNSKLSPVLLFWVGITFLVISSTRFGTILGLLSLPQTRTIIGLFYPFVLVIIFLDGRKLTKGKNK